MKAIQRVFSSLLAPIFIAAFLLVSGGLAAFSDDAAQTAPADQSTQIEWLDLAPAAENPEITPPEVDVQPVEETVGDCVPNPRQDLVLGRRPPTGEIGVDEVRNRAWADLTNHSTNCTYTIALSAYRVTVAIDPNGDGDTTPAEFDAYIRGQRHHSVDTAVIAPGETMHLDTPLPNCQYQVDLYEYHNTTNPVSSPPSFTEEFFTLFDWKQNNTRSLCDQPTPLQPTCSLSINDADGVINLGESRTLTWGSTNGVEAKLDGVVVALNGSETITPTTTTTYTFIVTGQPGTTPAQCQTTITVQPPIPNAPTCSLRVDDGEIASGGITILRWNSTNGVEAKLDGVVVTLNGSETITPTTTTTYTFIVTGQPGTTPAQCQATVTVTPPGGNAPTCTLSNNGPIVTGGRAVLTWTIDGNPTNGSLTPDIPGPNDFIHNSTGVTNIINAATTFTLTVSNQFGSGQCSTTVSTGFNVPRETPSCIGFSTPAVINQGASSLLSWNINQGNPEFKVVSVFIGQEVNSFVVGGPPFLNAIPLTGSHTVTPPTSRTYPILVGYTDRAFPNAPLAVTTCFATVTVNPPAPQPSCSNFVATPANISTGQSSVLSWNSANGVSATIDNGIGGVALNGTKIVAPQMSTNYTLTITGQPGTTPAVCHTTLTVNNVSLPSCTLAANPGVISAGQSSTLSWSTLNANFASINQGIGAVKPGAGSTTVTPNGTTTYTMTVSDESGHQATCSATVTVNPLPSQPSCSNFLATPAAITSGQSSTLSWNSSNGVSASINNGVGTVALNGSVSVSPTQTTIYNLTITGQAGTTPAICQVAVVVNSVPPLPSCILQARPGTITVGGSSTLFWTTINAATAEINQGIGSVTPVAAGSLGVTPSGTTLYTMTVRDGNGRENTCSALVTVVPSTPQPTCSNFIATPASINPGQSSTLSWNSTNGISASISNGVGTVALNGSVNVSPAMSTTYVLVITGQAGTTPAICQAAITVNNVPPLPSCVLSPNPGSINPGQSSTLSWTTLNATQASIDQNIGTVTPVANGSIIVTPAGSTTYTMTVSDGQGRVGTCSATVTVSGGGNPPACTLTATPPAITTGGSSTLAWISTNATTASIDQGIGAVTPVAGGSINVTPATTTTYTMTVSDGQGRQNTCTATVTVGPAQLVLSKSVQNQTNGMSGTVVSADEGHVLIYTLTAQNTGTADVLAHVFTDTVSDIQQYATIANISNGGTLTAGVITWPAIAIPAGQTRTVTFQATIFPRTQWPQGGDLTLQNVYNNTVIVNLLRLAKTVHNDTTNQNADQNGNVGANQNDVLTYTLSAANSGNVAANNFVFSDNVSDLLDYATISDISDGGTLTGGVITWPALGIPAGLTKNVTFKATIKARSAWPTQGDFRLTNIYGNTVTVSLPTIVKSVTPDSIRTGQVANYTITLQNTFSTARTFTITDTMTTGLVGTNGGTLTFQPSSVQYSFLPAASGTAAGTGPFIITNLQPGATVTIQYSAVGTDSAISFNQSSTFINVARVVETGASDDAQVFIVGPTSGCERNCGGGGGGGGGGGRRIDGNINVFIQKEVFDPTSKTWKDADTVNIAALLTDNDLSGIKYRLMVKNEGNIRSDVAVEDTFSSTTLKRLKITDVEGATWDEAENTFTITSLGAGSTTTVTYTANFARIAGSVVDAEGSTGVNTAEITEAKLSGRLPFNFRLKQTLGVGRSDPAYVRIGDDILLIKQVDKDLARPGDELNYILTLRNMSSNEYRNVKFHDLFPYDFVDILSTSINGVRSGNTLDFERNVLGAKDTWVVRIKGKIKAGVQIGTVIPNIVRISADDHDFSGKEARVETRIDFTKPPTNVSTGPASIALLSFLIFSSLLGIRLYRRKVLS